MKWFFLLLLICNSVLAQSVFKVKGSKVITKLKFLGETRELLYYIPSSVDLKKPTTVVFYLHGGNSNMTQQRATDTADTIFFGKDSTFSRKEGMKNLADAMNFIVVMPTTTIGWGGNTAPYMREVLSLVRSELNPDPNRIYLAGHSMGAMGICRAANQLADEFAMFMPISGGFQPHLQTFEQVGPLFNTRVWVTVGEVDFDDFKKWNEDFGNFLRSKEVDEYFHPEAVLNWWEYEKHPGTHNPNIPLLMDRFKTFLKETQRNLYQPNLFGFVNTSQKKYFWLEARGFRPLDPQETALGVSFRLHSKNNRIELMIDRPVSLKYDYRPHLKDVRLHLSEKLFNLDQPIEVVLLTQKGVWREKTVLFNGIVPRSTVASEEYVQSSHDKGFMFETFLDLALPKN